MKEKIQEIPILAQLNISMSEDDTLTQPKIYDYFKFVGEQDRDLFRVIMNQIDGHSILFTIERFMMRVTNVSSAEMSDLHVDNMEDSDQD